MTKCIKVLNWSAGGMYRADKDLILVSFDRGILQAFSTYYEELWHKMNYDIKRLIPEPVRIDEYECEYELLIFRLLDFINDTIHYVPWEVWRPLEKNADGSITV